MSIPVLLLAVAIAWAAFTGGGDRQFDASVVLLLVGLAGLAGVPALLRNRDRPGDRLTTGAAILLPLYVAFQLTPLPPELLRFVSPARADLALAVAQATGGSTWAPITVSVPTTWNALARIASCAIAFLLVRSIAGSPHRRWWAIAPLVAVGAAVAAAAFLAGPSEGGFTAGTFPNRNHFANFNAVVLPLAVGSAAVALQRARHKGTGAVVMAAVFLGCAALMLVAGLSSWSKGGSLAMLASLFAMAAFGGGSRLSMRARIGFVAAGALLLVGFVVFLTPSGLVERFAVVTTNDPTEGRVPIWGDTLKLMAAYPLVGVGLGSYYPALLPFQTYGLELAWVNAHNDYLQMASELGLVGALILGAILAPAVWRAVSTADADVPREVRLLGLACVGALAAFLVHSISEFNAYVLSNALALSWVAGIAASLSGTRWSSFAAPRPSLSRGIVVVPAVLVLGLFSVASSIGWIVFLRSYRDDPRAERAFCRYGVCDSASAIDTLRAGPDPGIAYPLPVADMQEYLQRDQAAPDRWEDLGRSLLVDGRLEDARSAFEQAVRLAPRTPPTLLMAAEFYLDVGEPTTALALMSRALREGPSIDRAAFAVMDYRNVPLSDRLASLPDARAAQAHFQWTLEHARTADDVVASWCALVARGSATDRLATRFVDDLISRREPAAAADGWARYLAATGVRESKGEALFNGSFEREPTGSRFDWRIVKVPGLSAAVATDVRADGERSVAMRFDGSGNVSDLGVSQSVYLAGGRYRVHALARTEGVTTDQGLRLSVRTELEPGVQVDTDQVLGTTDWTPLGADFDVPAGGVLLRVELARTRSLKFDSNIAGTAWVDAVSVKRLH